MTKGDYSGEGEIVVLCPTREFPEGALEMALSFAETIHRVETSLILVIDEDEPRRAEYLSIPKEIKGYQKTTLVSVVTVPGGSLTKATNEALARVVDADGIVGHVGDDHNFRTPGWDNRVRDTLLATPGVAYAHDGFPTYWASMWFTNMIVPRTLGWLALPGTYHLAIDDVFMDLGAALPSLHYLEDVFIKHKHPMGGEVEDRAIVASHYTRQKRHHETGVYHHYLAHDFDADVLKLRAVLGMPLDEPIIEDAGREFRRALRKRLPDACGCGCCAGMAVRKRPQGTGNEPILWAPGDEPGGVNRVRA